MQTKKEIEEEIRQLRESVTELKRQGKLAEVAKAHMEIIIFENRYYRLFGSRIGSKRRSVNF